MSQMHYMKKYLKPYRKQLIIGPSFKLAEAILELTMPVLMAKIIDNGVALNDTAYILRMGLLMVCIAVTGLCCAFVCQYSASIASQGFGTALREGLFYHINHLSMRDIDAFGTDTLSTRITNDVNQLQTAVAMIIRLLIRAPFISIGCIAASVMINARLSAVIAAAVLSFVAILFVIMTMTSPLYTKVQGSLDMLTKKLRESLSGVRVIRAFVRSGDDRERTGRAADQVADNTARVFRISSLLNPVTTLIMNFAILAIIWFGGVLVNVGDMKTGEVVAFINYVTQVLVALTVVANLVVIFTKAYTSLKRVNQVLAVAEEKDGGQAQEGLTEECGWGQDSAAEDGGQKEAGSTDGGQQKGGVDTVPPAVAFEHVTFHYTDRGEPELWDIHFAVREGETFGIIGTTGSGKTTLVSLIARLYEVRQGRILLGGRDLRSIPLAQLRAQIAIAEQKASVFAGTIADNIKRGRGDASMEEIVGAAKAAQADEFICKKPGGYEAGVGRGGKGLSGGQRQRLVIARALVRRPRLLILDDSLSALDAATSAQLRKALTVYCRGMTTILISQSAAAIKNCDRILVLKDGRQEGVGTHEELLKSCEEYRELVTTQQEDGEEESYA